MQKVLILFGLLVLVIGLLWPRISQIPLGRLPGDLSFKRGVTSVHIPLMTCLLLSAALTVLLKLFDGR